MWDLVLKSFDGKNTEEVDKYLADGYEPFAVIPDAYVGYIICLKKEKSAICQQQPETITGKIRRAPRKSEAEEVS